jgi:hypothetical protein
LHAIGIDVEQVDVAAVVERVDIQKHAVVAGDLVVFGDARADQPGVVLADEYRVQVLVVVRKIGRGRLAHRRSIPGLVLAEIGDGEFRFARKAVQKVSQPRRADYARDLQGPHLFVDDVLLRRQRRRGGERPHQ